MTYKISDGESIPPEIRRGPDFIPPSKYHNGLMTQIVVTASDLMREQIIAALESGEKTSDAIAGLHFQITHPSYNIYGNKLIELIKSHRELIGYACGEFEKISPNQIDKIGNSHRTILASQNPQYYTRTVLQSLSFLERTGVFTDDIDYLKDILYITAIVLAQRKKEEN